MENTQATVQILNDLVQINNDRIEGYQRASKDLKDGDTELKCFANSGRLDAGANAAPKRSVEQNHVHRGVEHVGG